jgi:hypothetical protein
VNSIDDQAVLADIALNAYSPYAKLAAIGKITNQDILIHICRTGGPGVSDTAASKITNQSVLAEFLRNNDTKGIHHHDIVEKLTDQNLIFDVAQNAKDSNACAAAIKKLTDPKAILYIVKNGEEYKRRTAIDVLSDPEILADIAKSDKSDWVREAALYKLPDDDTLEDTLLFIVQNEKNSTVYNAAVRRLGWLCGKHGHLWEGCICKRCGAKQHVWEDQPNCIKRCRNCGEEEENHKYIVLENKSDSDKYGAYAGYSVQCTVCGKKDFQYVN